MEFQLTLGHRLVYPDTKRAIAAAHKYFVGGTLQAVGVTKDPIPELAMFIRNRASQLSRIEKFPFHYPALHPLAREIKVDDSAGYGYHGWVKELSQAIRAAERRLGDDWIVSVGVYSDNHLAVEASSHERQLSAVFSGKKSCLEALQNPNLLSLLFEDPLEQFY